ncbi:MAG: hypothetical protein O7C75_17070 [Verrucomicrobia bacterium]|nr:hypothetical protein [Verrucomicrobiota bacterium]
MRIKGGRDLSSGQNLFWLAWVVFLVATVFLILLVYLGLAGPRGIEKPKSWEVDESSVIEWMAKSVEAERAFEREWKKDAANPEMFLLLEEALSYQFKLRAIDPDDVFGSVTRLNYLLRRLENTKGKVLYSQARTHAEKAAELVARGDTLSAVPLLEEALSAQEWINSQLHGSSLVDLNEVARIRKWLQSLKTVDAAAQVDRYAEDGKVAYAAGDWDYAEQLFERAVVLQESINLNMPESSHVRWRFVQELKGHLRRIEAARMNFRVEELISASPEGSRTDNLDRALNLQLLLNERFPNTEFNNPNRVEELRHKLASDLSEANAALLQEQTEKLNSYLRQKDWPSVRLAVLELEGALKNFETRFSLTLLPDPALKKRVEWLIDLDDRLEKLVNHIDSRLVNHPTEDMQIFSTEVDQSLFETVMGVNPSRWIGEGYPVDSVGFDQASEFCVRLSWTLGREVKLPELRWFSVIDETEVREEAVWFIGTSEFKSQPVGVSQPNNGIYDLYGNLAEWVTGNDGSSDVGLFGGSGADAWDQIQESPVNWVAPNFRSRWAGFRFCVLNH